MNAPQKMTTQNPIEWSEPHANEDLPGLKAISTRDQSGRIITTFEGTPKAWMTFHGFTSPKRRLVGINSR